MLPIISLGGEADAGNRAILDDDHGEITYRNKRDTLNDKQYGVYGINVILGPSRCQEPEAGFQEAMMP